MKSVGEVIVPNKTAAKALVGCGIFNILAYWVFMAGLKNGDFSIVLPLRNTVPIFTLIIGITVLKERINFRIVAATLLVIVGVIILQSSGDYVELTPSKILATPSLLAILSAFFFALTVMTNRYGTAKDYGKMNVLLFTTATILIMVLGYGLIVVFQEKTAEALAIIKTHWLKLFLVGFLGALGSWLTFKAFSVGEIIKVTPALRAQVLLSIFLGGAFFHEENIILRGFGGLLLTIGIVLIAIPVKKKGGIKST